MKFCLSSRQTDEYLSQADEIRVQYRDYKQIYDLLDKFPKATIILNCQTLEEEPFLKAIRDFVKLAPERIILSLYSFADIKTAKEFQLPFYIIHPFQTLEQLRAVKELGVCYALIDNLLPHQLHEAKITGVPLRAIPNIAHLDAIPRENGITGNWIRPEDLDQYSLYIDAIEFGTQPQKREQALFRIYHTEKSFGGDLGRIVQDFNALGSNAFLNSEITLTRMNCGLKCATSQGCSICQNILYLSSRRDLIDEYENR